MSDREFIEIVENANSNRDAQMKIYGRFSDYYRTQIIKRCDELGVMRPIYKRLPKQVFDKTCPVCNVEFSTKYKKQITCGYSCSNTYFRSGLDNPNWKGTDYRAVCFLHHEKKCVICGEEKIVGVHHYDYNNKNNDPGNLIPMCPTHHQYVHSRYKDKVIDKVNEYRDNWIKEKDSM